MKNVIILGGLLAIAVIVHMVKNPEEPISIDNVMERSESLNVKCFALKDPIPDFTVEVIGHRVDEVCGGLTLGCLIDGKHIKLWDTPESDPQVYAHEFAHVVCKPGTHYLESDGRHIYAQ